MFYLIFGIIWIVICLHVIIPFYNPEVDTVIEVNGTIMSHEEFAELFWPKFVLGFILLIGIIVFIAGLYIVIRDYRTNRLGKKTVGLLVNVEANGKHVNDQDQFDAVLLVLVDNNETRIFRDNIGFEYYNYLPGEFYEVLQHKNDINIVGQIDPSSIDQEKLDILKNAAFTNPEIPAFFEPTEVVIDNLKKPQ